MCTLIHPFSMLFPIYQNYKLSPHDHLHNGVQGQSLENRHGGPALSQCFVLRRLLFLRHGRGEWFPLRCMEIEEAHGTDMNFHLASNIMHVCLTPLFLPNASYVFLTVLLGKNKNESNHLYRTSRKQILISKQKTPSYKIKG